MFVLGADSSAAGLATGRTVLKVKTDPEIVPILMSVTLVGAGGKATLL